jgi:isoleucyl-tRNA synthetase
VIWTTTPWTMPGNRALAYGKDIAYGWSRSPRRRGQQGEGRREDGAGQGSWSAPSAEAAEVHAQGAWAISAPGRIFDGLMAAHPWRGQGYDFDVAPVCRADFVTADAGTVFRAYRRPGHWRRRL